MGKAVGQFFPFCQKPLLFGYIRCKPVIGMLELRVGIFQPYICGFQAGQGLLQVIGHLAETVGELSKFVVRGNGAWL